MKYYSAIPQQKYITVQEDALTWWPDILLARVDVSPLCRATTNQSVEDAALPLFRLDITKIDNHTAVNYYNS